jgi:CDP-4-dehydro-6-deoxyglucose reductase, E3
MTFRVELSPSGRVFEVAPGDTLLEAGLRAGFALSYGCSGGNCGLCRARVITGETRKAHPHDYVFPERERAQGWILLCSYTPQTDLVLEAGVAFRPDEIEEQEVSTRVKAITPLTDKVRLLHLQTPRSTRLRFLAGQTVVLGTADGARADYPVASCPCDDRNLQFHVRDVPEDAFASRVFHGMKAGDTIPLRGPHGRFVLDPDSTRPVILLACNSGFAPIKSVAEHAMQLERAPTIHLYWLATTPGGHYMANRCRAWMDALDNFRYTESAAASLQGSNIQTFLAQIRGDYPDLSGYDIYLAGPAEFVTQSRAMLIAAGAMPEHLKSTVA